MPEKQTGGGSTDAGQEVEKKMETGMGTIDTSYRREMNHNYMIIRVPDAQPDGYECRMLAGNNIEGLLKFRQKRTETGVEFYYEITSRQPLSRLLDGRLVSYEEIRDILLTSAGVLRRIEEFLLKEEQILLEPGYIYIEPEDFSVFFCLVPGYRQSFPAAFTRLLQYILEKVNHQDHRSVVLAYGLYHESLKENYGMEDLLKYLSGVEGGKQKWDGFYDSAGGREEKVSENEEYETERTEGKYLPERQERENREVWENGSQACKAEAHPDEDREQERKRGLLSHPFSWLFICAAMELAIYFLEGSFGLRKYGIFPAVLLAGAYFIYRMADIIFFERKKEEDGGDAEKKQLKAAEKETGKWQEGQGENKRRRRKGHNGTDRGGLRQDVQDFMQEQERPSQKKEPRESRIQEKEEWNILFRALDDEEPAAEDGWEEKNTQLLSDCAEPEEKNASLESTSRERKNIDIPYVPFLIGKNSEMSDFVLDYPTVSRMHLRIDKKEEVYIFTDMNSTNGTTVNGYRLEANETVSVKEGDMIQIAGLGYRFREF